MGEGEPGRVAESGWDAGRSAGGRWKGGVSLEGERERGEKERKRERKKERERERVRHLGRREIQRRKGASEGERERGDWVGACKHAHTHTVADLLTQPWLSAA